MIDGVRFRRLAAAQWAERGREFGWFLAAVVALQLVTVVIMLSGESNFLALSLDGQSGSYMLGLVLAAPVFAARYFLPLSRKDAELTVLMRPATTAEKFLLALATVAVAFPIAYTLAFYLTDIPAALVAQSRALAAWAALAPDKRNIEALSDPQHFGIVVPQWGEELVGNFLVLLMLLVVLGWTVFGTLYFRRSPLLKTFAAGFGIFLLVLLAGQWGGMPGQLFDFWHVKSPLAPWQRAIALAFWLVTPCLAWTSVYFALRDREAA